MLRQQVNLLDFIHSAKVEKYNISIRIFILLNVLFNLIMIIIFSMQLINLFNIDKQVSGISHQLSISQKKLSDVKKRFPSEFFDKTETSAQNEIVNEIATSKSLLRELSRPILFSSILLSLSKNITDQAWLTKITVENEGDNITLNGHSYSVLELERFVNRLSEDENFPNRSFNISKVVNRNEKNKLSALDFEVKITEKDKHEHNK